MNDKLSRTQKRNSKDRVASLVFSLLLTTAIISNFSVKIGRLIMLWPDGRAIVT